MLHKPKLRLDFADFSGTNKADNWFTRILAHDFEIEISDRPDLLIFQDGGHLNRLYTCKKLFWTGESILPDWRRTDYAMTCHYMDDPRHLRFPFYVWGSMAKASDLIKQPGEAEAIIRQQRKFCATVISNANLKRAGERVQFFQKLTRRKTVASGGRFMNNVGELPPGGPGKLAFIKGYKFNLCYENKSLPGYTTEKLTDAMWARCIPIYWGNERVGEEFNKASLLFRPDFSSDEEFLDRILEIDGDERKYREILEQPYFLNNVPNEMYDENRIRTFFHQILDDSTPPISRRRPGFSIGRWVFVKRQHF